MLLNLNTSRRRMPCDKVADSLPDPEVKSFVAQTLPVLKQHLAMIKAIASDLHLSPGAKQ